LDDPNVGEYFFRHLQQKKSRLLNLIPDDERKTIRELPAKKSTALNW